MKIISEEDFKKSLKEKIGTPIRVCFNNEEREPLYLFIDEKEQNCILKQSFKDCVSHFLKEQLIPFEEIRIEPFPFHLNNK
ncbi:hypothetical protein [Odoribacter lunatus]|uniref:hypothetical protein n=1 Tax=Odoribacter lunatus TaxID=2941335 RepID=UPI00203B7920|nr:hypothetical protein [Odoribacter lunatus]